MVRSNETSCTNIDSHWDHPYLSGLSPVQSLFGLRAMAYDYFLRFLPFFRDQAEGNLNAGVSIEFSQRMKLRLGHAELFEDRILLNAKYFLKDPNLLPYTLFHELVHLWLYHCGFDPSHTVRFYKKMKDFEATHLPVDPGVHIHRRINNDCKFVYSCSSCTHRWYRNEDLRKPLLCGYCMQRSNLRIFLRKHSNDSNKPFSHRPV